MGKKKVRTGKVVSDKMDKTVVVAVETFGSHLLYKKKIRKVKRYKSHDENNTCQFGDKVKIMETRPLSKEKRWRVTEIISRGYGAASSEAMDLGGKREQKTTDVTDNAVVKEKDDSEL